MIFWSFYGVKCIGGIRDRVSDVTVGSFGGSGVEVIVVFVVVFLVPSFSSARVCFLYYDTCFLRPFGVVFFCLVVCVFVGVFGFGCGYVVVFGHVFGLAFGVR